MNENLRILKPYLRGLPIILLAMAIGVMVAKKYLSYATPMYESTAKLKLADKGEGTPGSNLFKDFDVFASYNKIAAEIEILKSQILVNKVIASLDLGTQIYRVGKIRTVELFQNSPVKISYTDLKEKGFDRSIDLIVTGPLEYTLLLSPNQTPLKGKMGKPLTTELGTFTISLNDSVLLTNPNMQVSGNYRFEIWSSETLYEKLSKNLDIISVDKDVAVIRISFKDANPLKASLLVNRLAEIYIQDFIDTKYKAANVTVNFLNQQISNVMQKVSSSENNIQSYRDGKNITNIAQETETDLRKISQLKIQLTNQKMSLDAIQQLDNYIKKGKNNFLELAPNFEAFTDLLSTEMVKKIKGYQAEKKDLLLTYTPEDEKVKVIDAKINDLTSYLIESIHNTRINQEIKYRNLEEDINAAEKVFIGVPEKEKKMNSLNREFNIYQQSYNFLNEKKIEAEIAQSAKIAFHRIISRGEVAKKPVSPNKSIIVIVSAILAMLSSMLFIYLVHTLKAKVNDIHTIETNSTIPVAVVTPKLIGEKILLKHFLTEVIQLEIKGLIKQNSSVCLTAFKNSDGAAFNAFHLAQAMASQKRKVLLIDVANQLGLFTSTNCDRPDHSQSFEIRSFQNLEYNFYTQDKMNELLGNLKKEFEFVVLLNESLEQDTKSKLIMSLADLNLIVLDSRLTPEKRILETELLKEEYKFPAIHFLLNRFAYSPSIFKEIKMFSIKSITILKKKFGIKLTLSA